MAYSFQKSTLAKALGVSLIMLLAACSSDSRYKRQVDGNDIYLQAAPLAGLHAPAGMILPIETGDYSVSSPRVNGPVGKALDIRPPSQALALVSGAQTRLQGDTVTMMLEGRQAAELWKQVVRAVQANNFPVAKRDDAGQTLNTDWVQWNRADEDYQYRGRYQIAVQPQGYQQALVVKVINLEQGGKPVADAASMQRYSTQMLNAIAANLNNSLTARADGVNPNAAKQINVQSGADDTGLPVLIVRAPFNAVWNRLPNVLPKVGMKITDTTRSQGRIEVKYDALSGADWTTLGAKDPGLADGAYKLQIGDLDNRSSLQFIDPKGHPLTQSQNDALVAVFQAAFNK